MTSALLRHAPARLQARSTSGQGVLLSIILATYLMIILDVS